MKLERGSLLIELLLAIGLSAIILPGLLSGLVASRDGKPQQEQRMQATALLKETEAALKNVRDDDWATLSNIPEGIPYHPTIASNRWTLAAGVATNSAGFSQQIVLSDVYRNSAGAIVTSASGNILDPSTIKADITITWSTPNPSTITSTMFLTRTTNLSYSHTTQAQFNAGTTVNTQVTNDSGGEIKLANNNKAKWCSPSFALNSSGTEATIDLPDGPPVAVAATASATTALPNDVFVATAPYATSSAKLAYVNVSANTETPTTTLKGTFTLDSSKYTSGTFPTSLSLNTNSFRTTDVQFYKSSGGNTYALLATDMPDKEVIAVWVNDGNSANDTTSNGEYQDPTNKIFKYKTFFNTRRYNGVSTSTNDQAPYNYGVTSMDVLGDRGYIVAGGYLYVFNLSNIDSIASSSTTGLSQVGCRIEVEGFDCKANTSPSVKYSAGQTGTSWSTTRTPTSSTCSDGGNIEINATNDIDAIQVGTSTYVYGAVGAGATEEFFIVNATQVPTSGTSPSISSNSCGRYSSSASSNNQWKDIGNWDFNSSGSSEEASNSVYAKTDGTRAYISSNGGIDADGNGQPDSKQFYILNTTTKNSPRFLTGTESSGATSGFYYGASPNDELYPRRSLTVLNGQRAVLVGKDSNTSSTGTQEYQVLNLENESTPTYCSGVNFDAGFNDLTSVSEADYDNYVYMVANTTANELKIVQGGPDNAIYLPSGSYESPVFDTASVDGSTVARTLNRLLANIIQPATTSVKIQVAVRGLQGASCPTASSAYTYVGPDGSDTSYYTSSTAVIADKIPFGSYLSNAYVNPDRCFRYKVTLESPTDQTQTPVLQDITWNYSQ